MIGLRFGLHVKNSISYAPHRASNQETSNMLNLSYDLFITIYLYEDIWLINIYNNTSLRINVRYKIDMIRSDTC